MQDSYHGKRKPPKRSATRKIVDILYWVAILAGLWFAWLNINPYAQIIKIVAATATGDKALYQLIGAIPILNGIASTIGVAIHWLIGALAWLIIQILEVFRIFLKYDRAFTKVLIDVYNTSDRYDIKEEDPPALAAFKRWYNNFPWLTMSNARNYALFAYTVDFCICLLVYPPVEGGFGELMYVLFSGQFDQIQWNNVLMLIFTLFIIEIIVHLLFWLDQIVLYMKMAHGK